MSIWNYIFVIKVKIKSKIFIIIGVILVLFQSLQQTHDRIAEGEYDQPSIFLEKTGFNMHPPSADFYPMGDAIRMVGVRKSRDEPLVSYWRECCDKEW